MLRTHSCELRPNIIEPIAVRMPQSRRSSPVETGRFFAGCRHVLRVARHLPSTLVGHCMLSSDGQIAGNP
jgi:hypothetical protein